MKFRTDGMRGLAKNFNLNGIRAMGQYIAMSSKIRPILIGRDTRKSGGEFVNALIEGISSTGQKVISAGFLPTPAISFLTKKYGAGYGVMVTASHNPKEYNGLKFFDVNGKKIPKCVQSALERVYEYPGLLDFESDYRYVEEVDKVGQELYLSSIKPQDFKLGGFEKKIVLDLANGATSLIGERLFKELDFNPIVYNSYVLSGNINDNCGSCHPEFISRKVREEGAYCGIALDGDGDRVIFCDEKGKVIDGDQILTYLAIDSKFRNGLNGLVLTDYSNYAVDDYLAQKNILVERVRNGDINVMNKMRELGINLGGEKSGHIVLGNNKGSGDGLHSAVELLSRIDLGIPISEQLDLVKMNPQTLFNIPLKASLNGDGRKVQDLALDLSNEYDLRRIFVRESGTEALLRVLVEGESSDHFGDVKKRIKAILP